MCVKLNYGVATDLSGPLGWLQPLPHPPGDPHSPVVVKWLPLRSPRQSVSFVVIVYERPLPLPAMCVYYFGGLSLAQVWTPLPLVSFLSSDYCAHDVIVVYCRKSIFDQRWQD